MLHQTVSNIKVQLSGNTGFGVRYSCGWGGYNNHVYRRTAHTDTHVVNFVVDGNFFVSTFPRRDHPIVINQHNVQCGQRVVDSVFENLVCQSSVQP
jgi:hypothetical protein